MNFNSPTPPSATPASSGSSLFDLQGFKNLLDTLRESKDEQENKAKPVYNLDE